VQGARQTQIRGVHIEDTGGEDEERRRRRGERASISYSDLICETLSPSLSVSPMFACVPSFELIGKCDDSI
jgi:hypothetical protein